MKKILTILFGVTLLFSCEKSELLKEKCESNIQHYNELVHEYNEKWQILTDNGETIYWAEEFGGGDIWDTRDEEREEINELLDEIYFDGCKYTEYDCDKHSGEYCYFQPK